MDRSRRAVLLGVALAGYAAAFAGAGWLVALRYRWEDPAAVSASSGMYAFGDLVWGLAFLGVLSIPATAVLLRALRDLEGFWRALSWGGLCWAALAPAALAIRLANTVVGLPQAALAADAFAVLRLLASPASLPALVIAWWACGPAPARRRLRLAVLLEASGVAGYAVWLLWAVLRARS